MDLHPDRALAVTLLADNRTAIAQAIVRLARRLEPRWANVPSAVAEASAENQLKAVEKFLKTDDPTQILDIIRDLVRLRRHVGFGVGDFAVKSHAYLPVIRKVFMRSKVPLAESLSAYDIVEGTMLPLMARILQEMVAAPVEDRVDDLDDLDDTVPGARRAALISLNPFTMVDVEEDLRPTRASRVTLDR